jgi:hypothetical protein
MITAKDASKYVRRDGLNIGAYVKQHVFQNSSGGVWRYGIVIEKEWESMPAEIQAVYVYPVRVVFTPCKSHPVGVLPYAEYVESAKLEVVSV